MKKDAGTSRALQGDPLQVLDSPIRIGKYEAEARLGRGGCADVLLARAHGATEQVVVKRLRKDLIDDPEQVEMFLSESELLSHLQHPNIVRLVDRGKDANVPFLVLEHVPAEPLSRLVRHRNQHQCSFSVGARVLILADLLAALQHAHDARGGGGHPLRIVHRDVTPENVLIGHDGQVRLADFGIARSSIRHCTPPGSALKGKVRYMSPEQAGAGEIDRRTDVFGAGMILWQLLAERRFWGELDAVDVLSKLMTGSYDPSLQAIVPDAPDELEKICKRALSYSKKERYASAAEMRVDVVSFLSTFQIEDLRKELATLTRHLSKETMVLREDVIETDPADQSHAVPPPPTSRSIQTPRAPVSMLATVRASSIVPVSRTLTPLPLPVPVRFSKTSHAAAARRKTWLAVALAGICVLAALSSFGLVFGARVASASAGTVSATAPRAPRSVVSDLQPSAPEIRSRAAPPPSKRKRVRSP